jgi:hypothetical protein
LVRHNGWTKMLSDPFQWNGTRRKKAIGPIQDRHVQPTVKLTTSVPGKSSQQRNNTIRTVCSQCHCRRLFRNNGHRTQQQRKYIPPWRWPKYHLQQPNGQTNT